MKSNIKATGFAFACALACAGTAAAADLRLMTGPQGGAWVPLGGQLKDMWEKAIPNLSVQALPGAGIANVRGIEENKTDLGFGNSISTVDAVAGKPPFNKPHGNVCNVATLYPQYFQVVVRADAGVNSIKDLKGKGIAAQPRGNTAEEITKQLLQVNGLTYNDVKMSFVSYTDAVTQVQDGHAVAFTAGTTIPSSAVMDLATSRDVKILDLADQLAAMKQGQSRLHAQYHPQGHLSEAGQGHAGDRLRHPHRRLLQAARGYGLRHDQDDLAEHPAALQHRQGHPDAHPEGHGREHRRSVPPRRRQVLQGGRHRRADQLMTSAGRSCAPRPASSRGIMPT